MDRALELLKSLDIDRQKDYVVVACSGGPDSMFLLDLLYRLNYRIVVAHVNHNVRSESDDEYRFLEDYCKEKNIIFEGTKILDYPRENFHDFARKYRYRFFEEILHKYHAPYLFTAHHGDDLMETILMRISRGSSLRGYAGFQLVTKREDYQIIRPLVSFTKDEILALALKDNIPYVHDLSNENDHYLRNRFRHHLLPLLKQENPKVHLKFLEYNREISEVSQFVANYVDKIYPQIVRKDKIDVHALKNEDSYIQRQIIYRFLHNIYNEEITNINQKHMAEIMAALNAGKPNVVMSLPHRYEFIKEYGQLYISKHQKFIDYECILEDKVEVPLGNISLVADIDDPEYQKKSNYFIRLRSCDIALPLKVRNRRSGDYIKVKNLEARKKIKDIFINEKVDISKRNEWPILIDSNNTILWLPGLKKSEFDVPIGGEYDIIVKYEKKENHDEQ